MKTYVALSVIVLTIGFVFGDKIELPIPCKNTSDCRDILKLPNDSFCENGHCMCLNVDNKIKNCSSLNTSIHENKSPGPLIYRTCKHDQECFLDHGICNSSNNQCECMKDYVPSSNKQHCVEKVHSIEAPCTDQNQCLAFLANTTCKDKKCVCASGYHYVNNTCWKMVEFGKHCTKDQDCSHTEGVVCNDKICQCASEMIFSTSGQRCVVPVKKIRDECTDSIQCYMLNYALCIDKMCQCQIGFHYEHDQRKCFSNIAIDANCENNYECYQAEDYENDPPTKSMICEGNKCTCASNYIRQKDKCVNAGSSFVISLSIISALICGTLFL